MIKENYYQQAVIDWLDNLDSKILVDATAFLQAIDKDLKTVKGDAEA